MTLKPRNTAHRVAAKDPKNRHIITNLRRHWEQLDALKRAEQVEKLIARGCTLRGLATDLGKSAASLSNYKRLASAPPEDRDALRAGASAKRVAAKGEERARQRALDRLIAEENKTGKPSDEIADLILDFLYRDDAAQEEFHVLPSQIATVLRGVREITHGEVPGPLLNGVSLPRGYSRRELYECTKPIPQPVLSAFYEETPFGYRQRWLARILMSITPVSDIRDHAMNKAEERAEADSWDLEKWQASLTRPPATRTGSKGVRRVL